MSKKILVKEVWFEELDFSGVQKKLILLDIDGTLLPNNTAELSPPVLQKIKELKNHNLVWLCTNSKNHQRNQSIAATAAIPLSNPNARKPSKKILGNIPPADQQLAKIVIGDAFLIDGLCALRIDAEFWKIKRKISPDSDRWFIRLFYFVDNIIFKILKKWLKST